MKVYLCEENRSCLERTKQKVEQILCSEGIDMEIAGAYTEPEKLLKKIRQESESALYILDAGVGKSYDGIELASRIRRYDARGFIVFLSSHTDMAVSVLKRQVEAIDFIVKGEREEEELRNCIHTVMERYTSKSNYYEKLLNLHTEEGVVWLDLRTLVYAVPSQKTRWLWLHLDREEEREVRQTLKGLMELLDGDFRYCHRGCVVNMAYVKAFDEKNNYLILKSGEKLEVSVRCRKNFQEKRKRR
ncbi:MAG: response regulator transcription factor [Lachnospiraceae bacterium]|nr:response regulator transcription factor [Lachnospiraceae bacterium]